MHQWKENNKLYVSFIIEAIVLVALVFGVYGILGVQELFSWKYGVRTFITGVFMLFLLELSFHKTLSCMCRKFPAVLFVIYTCIFPVVVCQIAGDMGVRAETVNPYFQMGLTLTVLLCVCLEIGKIYHRIRIVAGGIALGILYFIAISLFCYVGYYGLFHTAFSDDDMKVLLMTNSQEAYEFVLSHVGIIGLLGLVIGSVAIAGLFFMYVKSEFKQVSKISSNYSKIEKLLQIILMIGCTFMMNHWLPRSFPGYEYRHAAKYIESMKQLELYHKTNIENLKLDHSENTLAQKVPGTVIVIIGETANRDHMKAFNSAYPEETTPWLSQQKKDFFLFNKAYSNYPITMNALFGYLTNINQYNQKSEKDIITITDVASLAGYDTYWISNQDKDTSVVPLLASASSKELWTKPAMGDDMHVLDLLKQVPHEKNNFIVIHLWGSHDRYKDRVPADFPKFDYGEKEQRTADYDSSIRYVDKVIENIFEYAKENLNLQVLTYCSDHGEDMLYTHHGGAGFTFDMVRVPLFIYLSPEYQKTYPAVAANLSAHQGDIFTNDLMFDTICGLLQAPNSAYENTYDLSNKEYHLPIDRALTAGNIKVANDAALYKDKN